MINRLFVYGTLAPGQTNEHVMAEIVGTWEPATVKGTVFQGDCGSARGYPGIVLDEYGSEAHGLIFRSDDLIVHWDRLDDFEGNGYKRVVTSAKLENGKKVKAYIYVLKGKGLAPG